LNRALSFSSPDNLSIGVSRSAEHPSEPSPHRPSFRSSSSEFYLAYALVSKARNLEASGSDPLGLSSRRSYPATTFNNEASRAGSHTPPRPSRRRGGWGHWDPEQGPLVPPPASRSPRSLGLLPHRRPKVLKGKAALALCGRRRTHPLSRCPYPSAGRALP
jgi:hypothetical protein